MEGKDNLLIRTGKDVLALNLGTVIRTALGGLREGRESLDGTYRAVSPFSPLKHGEGRKMLEQIPMAPLSRFGGIPEQIHLDLRYVDVDGSMPYRDLVATLTLAKNQGPKAALEFGTYFGSTTVNLAMNLPEARVHTIDLPEDAAAASALIAGQPVDDLHLIQGRQLGKSFRGTPFAERIVQHQGDTATYDYSAIQDDVTFFMIDGAHTYEYAKSDTLKSFAIARGECTFVWHDCDQYTMGVLKWLLEMLKAGLPVYRIEKTSVACMKINAQDPRVTQFLQPLQRAS